MPGVWSLAGVGAAATTWQPTFTLQPTFGFNGIADVVLKNGTLRQLALLRASVWRWQLAWSAVEQSRGVYDFSVTDDLLKACNSANLAAYIVLGSTNDLYCDGNSAVGDCVSAFSSFAMATIGRYAGQGVFWGLLDEPNVAPADAFSEGGGWTPAVNVTATAALLVAVGTAARAKYPNETLVGPALAPALDGSGFDVAYMSALFAAGVLPLLHAVDIHPFQGPGEEAGAPEYAINDYFALRNLLTQYAPPPIYVPILASAWGYSTASSSEMLGMPQPVVTETAQAKFIGRMTFVDLGCGVNLTTWYAAVDAGSNSSSTDDNFGLLRYGYHNSSAPYVPKPAFTAAAVVADIIAGCSFVGLLEVSFLPDPLPLPPCFAAYMTCPVRSGGVATSARSNATEPAYAFWCATSNDTALQPFTFDAVFNTTPAGADAIGPGPASGLYPRAEALSFVPSAHALSETTDSALWRIASTVHVPGRARDMQNQRVAGALCLASFDYLGAAGPTVCAGGDPLAFNVQAGNGPTYLRGVVTDGERQAPAVPV